MIEAAPKRNILLKWLFWHFVEVTQEISKGWKNFLLFNLNYFSIPLLAKTLFSHWRRYRESYGKGFDPKRYLNAFFSNLISRVLGAIARFFIIIVGIIAEFFVFIGGLIVLLVWLSLPALLILALGAGIGLLI